MIINLPFTSTNIVFRMKGKKFVNKDVGIAFTSNLTCGLKSLHTLVQRNNQLGRLNLKGLTNSKSTQMDISLAREEKIATSHQTRLRSCLKHWYKHPILGQSSGQRIEHFQRTTEDLESSTEFLPSYLVELDDKSRIFLFLLLQSLLEKHISAPQAIRYGQALSDFCSYAFKFEVRVSLFIRIHLT